MVQTVCHLNTIQLTTLTSLLLWKVFFLVTFPSSNQNGYCFILTWILPQWLYVRWCIATDLLAISNITWLCLCLNSLRRYGIFLLLFYFSLAYMSGMWCLKIILVRSRGEGLGSGDYIRLDLRNEHETSITG